MRSFRFILLFLLISGCMDQCQPTKYIPGPYMLMESEDNSWGLYYDLKDGGGHGRIMNVKQIGWTDKYILAYDGEKYFFLDKTRDNGLFNANEIVTGPLQYDKYIKLLDSLRLKDFKFQTYLK